MRAVLDCQLFFVLHQVRSDAITRLKINRISSTQEKFLHDEPAVSFEGRPLL
jgi:hypothetical protein